MKKFSDKSAVILAGGKGTRMKGEKAFLPVSGVKLIEKVARNLEPYFGEILISARSKEMFDFLPFPIAVDEQPGCGPLMGILSTLRVSRTPINFVIACDIPEIDIDFIETMAPFTGAYDIVVPTSGENKFEPLFAFYNKNLIPVIEDLLARGIRKINRLYSKCRTKYIPFKNDGWYHNLNTKEDYRDYLSKE
jgi:molybdopterin-guanine dinucleotide biosynthesis protein A